MEHFYQRAAKRHTDPLAFRVAEIRSGAFDRHFENAVRASDRGDEKTALREFSAAAHADPTKWGNVAAEALMQGKRQDALRLFTQTAQLARDNKTRAAALTTIGTILQELGRQSEAEKCFQEAVDLWPTNDQLLVNLATSVRARGDLCGSLALLFKALQRNYNHLTLFNRSMTYLLMGNLEQGFRDYESRFDNPKGKINRLKCPQPTWTGQDLKGKTLLVCIEQGVGDTIMMLRYMPLLKAMGATLKIITQPKTGSLIETLDIFDEIIEQEKGGVIHPHEIPDCDYHINTMSLPYRFKTTLNSIPPPIRFPIGICPWPLRVGICWAGSFDHKQDIYRSTLLEDWPLDAWAEIFPAMEFYSLQAGPRSMDIDSARAPVMPFAPDTYLDTALAIAACDLIISVDTSIVHLAGSMGQRVWMLTPHAPDWRWLDPRHQGLSAIFVWKTPWYPTVRLFRQQTLHDWASVFGQITTRLRNLWTSNRSSTANAAKDISPLMSEIGT